MNTLKKLIHRPQVLRFVSPVVLGILFCASRSIAVYLDYAQPFPVEMLNPLLFLFVTILCIFSFITLILYPAFWITDRIFKKSNGLVLIPSLLMPIFFTLFVHIVILNEPLLHISWTKSWSAYFLSALVSGWGASTWVLSRTTKIQVS